ncbi:hypothetical protein BT93_A0129 [Corymbia citriodora subsp. variegata]|nr:hypothetical protein BT93_A0129 [Corymbia citriodora subsp. variegata]
MEVADDDFGALYVDDSEFGASQPTGSLVGCSDSWVRPVGGETPSGNGIGARNAGKGIGSELKSDSELRRFEGSDIREDGGRREEEEVEVGSGSDSEGDLNIVVNDEDCRAFPGLSTRSARDGGGFGDDADGDVDGVAAQNGVGMSRRWSHQLMNGGRDCNGAPSERGTGNKQLKFRGPRGTGYARANYLRANTSGGIMALSMSARGDFEKNEDRDHKEVSCMVHAHAPSNLAVLQKGHSFSLPWYRNILDVNIDALKEKPWRYPGVDITDYFNFGLDEESWKQYCSSLTFLKLNFFLSSLSMIHSDRQKGKAIEVAENLGERQPSMVLRRPRSYNADVVIKIALPDSPKDYSLSSQNGLNFMHNTLSKALESGELHASDSRNTFQPHRTDKDNALMSHIMDEDNARRFDESVKGTRCFELTNASSLVDVLTSGDGKNSDGDGSDSQKACIQDAEGKAVAEQTKKKATQGVCGTSFLADSCIIQAEPSLGDRIQLSLSSLCFESESEASEDSISVALGKRDDDCRSPSFGSCNDFHDSSTCDRASVKTKPTNGTYNPRCRIHSQVGNAGEPDAFTDSDDVASNLSDSRGINNWDDLVVDHSRRSRRQGAIDHYYEEHVPYSRERVYGDERFDDRPIYTCYKLLSRGQQMSRNGLDEHSKRSQGEGENFFRGRFRENGKDLKRDGNHKVKCKCMKERNSFLHRDLSQLVSRYSTDTTKGKDPQSRLKSEDLKSNRRANRNGWFLARHKEEFTLENRRTSLSSTEWEEGCLENNSGRQLLYRREVKNFERRGGYKGNPPYGNDRCMELEDECQEYRDHERLSSQLHGESYASEKRRWDDTMSPRDELDHSRLFGLYRRFGRQSHSDEGEEGHRSHGYNKIDGTDDGIAFSEDRVHMERRKYGSQKSLPWRNDDKFLLKHQDDELHVEEVSFFHGRSMNRGVNPKYKDADCGVLDNDVKEERNWYKRLSMMRTCRCLGIQLVGLSGKERNASWRSKAANSVTHQAAKKWVDKLPVSAKIEDSEIEEGQIGMEEPITDTAWEKNHVPGDIAVTGNMKNKKQGPKKSTKMDEAIGGIDETQILETLAKMERRKERFKEPLTYKKEVEVKTDPQVNLMQEVPETKQERPARKRRWGGS